MNFVSDRSRLSFRVVEIIDQKAKKDLHNAQNHDNQAKNHMSLAHGRDLLEMRLIGIESNSFVSKGESNHCENGCSKQEEEDVKAKPIWTNILI
jgi:hypothetical protein